jgi:hypothetical protein
VAEDLDLTKNSGCGFGVMLNKAGNVIWLVVLGSTAVTSLSVNTGSNVPASKRKLATLSRITRCPKTEVG